MPRTLHGSCFYRLYWESSAACRRCWCSSWTPWCWSSRTCVKWSRQARGEASLIALCFWSPARDGRLQLSVVRRVSGPPRRTNHGGAWRSASAGTPWRRAKFSRFSLRVHGKVLDKQIWTGMLRCVLPRWVGGNGQVPLSARQHIFIHTYHIYYMHDFVASAERYFCFHFLWISDRCENCPEGKGKTRSIEVTHLPQARRVNDVDRSSLIFGHSRAILTWNWKVLFVHLKRFSYELRPELDAG